MRTFSRFVCFGASYADTSSSLQNHKKGSEINFPNLFYYLMRYHFISVFRNCAAANYSPSAHLFKRTFLFTVPSVFLSHTEPNKFIRHFFLQRLVSHRSSYVFRDSATATKIFFSFASFLIALHRLPATRPFSRLFDWLCKRLPPFNNTCGVFGFIIEYAPLRLHVDIVFKLGIRLRSFHLIP